MADYCFKAVKSASGKLGVRVTKFEDHATPTGEYLVVGESCDCPAGMNGRKCKHTRMAATWLAKGQPTGFFTQLDLDPVEQVIRKHKEQ